MSGFLFTVVLLPIAHGVAGSITNYALVVSCCIVFQPYYKVYLSLEANFIFFIDLWYIYFWGIMQVHVYIYAVCISGNNIVPWHKIGILIYFRYTCGSLTACKSSKLLIVYNQVYTIVLTLFIECTWLIDTIAIVLKYCHKKS